MQCLEGLNQQREKVNKSNLLKRLLANNYPKEEKTEYSMGKQALQSS